MEWCVTVTKNFLHPGKHLDYAINEKQKKVQMQDCPKIPTVIKKKVLKEAKEKDLKGNISTQLQ